MGEVIRINPSYILRTKFSRIVRELKRGGVVIYPTDTIYGIGCDICNRDAVEKIFLIKRRAEGKTALILASSESMVRDIFTEITPRMRALMREFWPGPLTIIARSSRPLHPYLRSEDGMVGIRIPSSRFCLRLIKETGTPIVSTSVNRSGTPPLICIKEIRTEFQSSVDLLVDAGDTKSSLASTVLRVDGDCITLLREGAISRKRCARYLTVSS
jgi:L-threonylcarbamoyladenylate synthase